MKSVLYRLLSSSLGVESDAADSSHVPVSEEKGSAKADLEGNISVVALDDVFQLFDYAGLTGELEVRGVDNKGFFFFNKGLFIFGMLAKNQFKLGEMLVDEEHVTSGQLDECLKFLRENKQSQRLGQILIEKGYLQKDNLADCLERQVKAAVFEALKWQEGRFVFHANHAPGKEEILIQERVDHLLLEGMVHIDDNG